MTFRRKRNLETRDLGLKVRGDDTNWHSYDIMMTMKSYDGENAEITKDIIACAIEVHKTLGGPGILEKVYQHALAYELQIHGHRAQLEASCPIVYKGRDLSDPEHPLRIDILVDDTVVVDGCGYSQERDRVRLARKDGQPFAVCAVSRPSLSTIRAY